MVTIKDIAEVAQVSHATVSYVLNGKAAEQKISRKVCEKILALADELGYQRNEIARSFATGVTKVVCCATDEITSEYNSRMLLGIMVAAEAAGYYIKVINVDSLPDKISQIVQTAVGQCLAGVICFGSHEREFHYKLYEALNKHHIPIAFANNSKPVSSCVNIYSDNRSGGQLAFRHLFELGHRKFAIINSHPRSPWAIDRINGFVEAARSQGVRQQDLRIFNDCQSFLNHPATALFCINDYMAMQCIMALQNSGFHVPEDVSVVGYGDLTFARLAVPQITTIGENLEQLGSRVFEQFLQKSILEKSSGYIEVMPVQLIELKSTASPCNSHFKVQSSKFKVQR